MNRLKKFRPAMAVKGPGLESETVRIEFAKATGAKVITTTDVLKPRFFSQHFTGMPSWIFRTETVPRPKCGCCYLVAYYPDNHTGKLWLSVGEKDSFKAEHRRQSATWREFIRNLYEVN